LISKQSIKQASILIAGVSIASQGLGVIREALLANYLGTSSDYDLLLISMALPMMIANILFLAIPSAGIPFLQGREKSTETGDHVLKSSFVRTNSLVTLLVAATLFIALPLLRDILARGLDDAQLDRFVKYGRLFCIVIPIKAYEGIYRTLLQYRRNFLFPALTILGFNFVSITILFTLFPSLGTTAFIMSWLMGLFAQMLIVAVPTYILFRREGGSAGGFEFQSSGYLKYLGIIVLVESFGLIVEPFDRYLAGTFLTPGFVSANYYAMMISSVPIRIFIYAMGTAIFPSLSEYAAGGRIADAGRLYHKTLSICAALIIPLSVYLYLYSDTIIKTILERGLFGVESRQMTVEVLRYYLIGLIFMAAFFIQLRVTFAVKSWRFMILTRLFSFAVKIIIGFAFIRSNWALAIGGGTAAMFIISFISIEIFISHYLKFRYSREDMKLFFKSALIAVVLTGLMVGTNLIIRLIFSPDPIVVMLVVGAISFGVFLLFEFRFRLTGFFRKSVLK